MTVQVGRKQLPTVDGTIVYDRPGDDELCALCNARATDRLDLPVCRAPVPVCRRHYLILDGLRWPGRRKRHHVSSARARLVPDTHGLVRLDVRTFCGRRPDDVELASGPSSVTCEVCVAGLERYRRYVLELHEQSRKAVIA